MVGLVPKTPYAHHPVYSIGRFSSAHHRILGFDADVKDHGFAANPSGNPRDTRRGQEIEITDLKRPRRQGEDRRLGVYVRGVVNVYDRTLRSVVGR